MSQPVITYEVINTAPGVPGPFGVVNYVHDGSRPHAVVRVTNGRRGLVIGRYSTDAKAKKFIRARLRLVAEIESRS